ncbi:choline transporter [Aspergillus sclerotioniger CBS 115572]|uniref:Choline transporter n=1 Tax=Aspergillus sclerotioniger CBS 115572 TaxID=1450535 RepID=A0A317WTN8_9EURO|nr:choline transporter [Aspergillus sclerotioniger CBS 115572]PWY89689.1 choline transporter [Aspergillus sclerotioniger CBS 115572]
MSLETSKNAGTEKRIPSDDTADIHHGVLSDIKGDGATGINGHTQAMPQQFSWLSALGFGFSITNSWVGYLSCFGQTLTYGGAQACIFSMVVAFMVQLTVTLGLAELASAYPSSGGQYHFCYILSPKRTKRYSAYVVGWLSVLAWWIVTCSGISPTVAIINDIANFCNLGYVANQWQTYLTYVAVAVITIIPVFVVSQKISLVTQFALYLSLAAYLVVFIVILTMHQEVQPGSFILASGQGNSGWSRGTSWLLAITNSLYAFGGTDGVIHICEELPRPGRRVPQVMIMTMIIGLLTSLSLFIALMFFIEDMDAVRNASIPSMELIYQITKSRPITLGLSIVLTIIYASALPSQWVTSGRIAWAFARDNGIPFPEFFTQIHPTLNFPVHTTLAALIFSTLYGLLYLASTTAFTSIITSAVLFLNITYTVPQGILLTRGRGCLPQRYLNLGRLGYVCNMLSVVWIIILGVLVCLPSGGPVVDLGDMNYVCVILVAVFGGINLLWMGVGRGRFVGPVVG